MVAIKEIVGEQRDLIIKTRRDLHQIPLILRKKHLLM